MGGMFSGGKGGSTPAPDFSKAAMVNQSGPMGGVTWGQGPNGQITMNTGFTGPAQGVWNNVMGGMGKGSQFDPSQASQQAFDKVYGSYQSRLDPMWSQREQGFNAQMANAGLDPGSQAYGEASRNFGQQRNDAYNQAIGQSVGLGQAEQAQARQNAMLPFMQAGQMMGMLPKGDAGAPLEAARDQYTAQRAADAQKQSGKGSLLGGLGGLAGTVFGGPLGGALGSAAGGLFSGKGGGGSNNYFGTGDPMAGHD